LEDLPLLAEFFLRKFQPPSTRALRLGKAGMELLRAYPWPGNVRELGNVLERAVILATREKQVDITPFLALAQLNTTLAGQEHDLDSRAHLLPLDAAIALHIRQALKVCGGKIYGVGGAAALLGVKPSTLQSKMQKLKVKPNGR
jgi:DNA-binding NtrC family response regulator